MTWLLRLWPWYRMTWLLKQVQQERDDLAFQLNIAEFELANERRRFWQMKERLERQIADLDEHVHNATS